METSGPGGTGRVVLPVDAEFNHRPPSMIEEDRGEPSLEEKITAMKRHRREQGVRRGSHRDTTDDAAEEESTPTDATGSEH